MRVDSLLFKNNRGSGFKLSGSVVRLMARYKQYKPEQVEAGGVLLGRFIQTSSDVVVDKITIPKRGDLRARTRFVRSARSHQEVVNREWMASRGTCHYLGEWHTHPELAPFPSGMDLVNWKNLIQHYDFDPDPLYFVIVGTQDICVWRGDKSGAVEKMILVCK